MVQENLFIIPNAAFKASEIHDLNWLSGRLYRQTGIEIKPDDVVIQATVSNWGRFGSFQEALGIKTDEDVLDAKREGRQVGFFAEYWPLRIFEGHKEGDELTLKSPEYGIEYKLQLLQRPSRYGKISATVVTKEGGLGIAHFGEFTFERALNFVTHRGEFA
jgi:hypothetical protein